MHLTLLSGGSAVAERVVLVDGHDIAIGSAEKLAAHREGLLHRACSVFVFNDAGALLLQRRAAAKYHSPGLWSNTCCGHPRPGEPTVDAARRRLREEMGVDCVLDVGAAMVYRAILAGGLTEHEYDHILVGRSNAVPSLNRAEADAYEWRDLSSLLPEMRDHADRFTPWFGAALRALIESGRLDPLMTGPRRDAIRRLAAEIVSPSATVITVMAAPPSTATQERSMSASDQIPSELLQRITTLATHDRNFRRLLLDDPIAAVETAFGVTLPPTFRVRFMERPPDADAIIVLDANKPEAAADGSLNDADLDAVAGGHNQAAARRRGTSAMW